MASSHSSSFQLKLSLTKGGVIYNLDVFNLKQ